MLIGERDGQALAYIGEGEEVGARIRDHDVKKDWWTTALIVTTSANELNKAHVKYLESRLVEQACAVGAIALDNGNTPPKPGLSEAGKSNMEEFLDTLFIVFPALGVDMFSNKRRPAAMATAPAISTSPRFVLEARKSGIRATAVLDNGEFVVLAASAAQNKWVGAGSQNSSYSALHTKLVEAGIILTADPNATFSENYAFSSPSAAAAVVLGRSANGRTEWVVEGSTKTYGDWDSEQLALVPL